MSALSDRVSTAVARVMEVEVGKPGANWTQVSPEAKGKLGGILKHYKGMAHPFTQCVKDNRKRFGDRAEKVCAVVKDLNERSTKWRKGPKTAEGAWDPEVATERLLEALGPDATDAEVELLCEALEERVSPLDRALREGLRKVDGLA